MRYANAPKTTAMIAHPTAASLAPLVLSPDMVCFMPCFGEKVKIYQRINSTRKPFKIQKHTGL